MTLMSIGQERVSSMSAQVESTNILRETSDVSNNLKNILQKFNLSRDGGMGASIAISCLRLDIQIHLHFLPR